MIRIYMVPYILGYLLCIYTVRAWHRSLIMVGMTESGDPATGNINHASVIRHEFECTCGVIDNLTPLGPFNTRRVTKPWSSFFLHQNLNLTFTLKKKIRESILWSTQVNSGMI